MTKTTATKTPKAPRAARTPKAPKQTPEQIAAIAAAPTDDEAKQDVAPSAGVPAPAKPAKAERVLPTLDEALATAKQENPTRYARVVRVTELTKDGSPKRVVIECADPQTKQAAPGVDESVCEGTREIAVQDLFQVECCAACADRKVRKARRNRAKARDKAARATVRALKGK